LGEVGVVVVKMQAINRDTRLMAISANAETCARRCISNLDYKKTTNNVISKIIEYKIIHSLRGVKDRSRLVRPVFGRS
jgi:hypothetical protein